MLLTYKVLLAVVERVVSGLELEVDVVPALVLLGAVAVRGVAAVPQAPLLTHQLDQLTSCYHLLREPLHAGTARGNIPFYLVFIFLSSYINIRKDMMKRQP